MTCACERSRGLTRIWSVQLMHVGTQGQLRRRIFRCILGRGCKNIRMTPLRGLRSRTQVLQGQSALPYKYERLCGSVLMNDHLYPIQEGCLGIEHHERSSDRDLRRSHGRPRTLQMAFQCGEPSNPILRVRHKVLTSFVRISLGSASSPVSLSPLKILRNSRSG